MRFRRSFAATVAALALIIGATQAGNIASAGPNPFLDKANGHSTLENGKSIAHPSSGTEVAFDDERAVGADVQSSAAADAPPDATATALGCANRGSTTNPRLNQDCTLRRQAEEQITVNPIDPTNIIAGQNDSRVGFNKCGFDYSLNGGTTWGDGLPPFYQHLSPIGHTYDAASDPAVTVDGTGRAWFACVLFDVASNASAIAATRSTAGLKGSAYSNVTAGPSPYIVAETASGAHFFDKEFIAADWRAGQTSVYITYTDFQASSSCKRSFNRGAFCASPIMLSKWTQAGAGGSWSTPIEISGHSPMCVSGDTFSNKQANADACNFDQGSFPVVLPNGDVYVVFTNYNTPTLVDQQLGVRVSFSAGVASVSAPVRVGWDDESRAALCDFGRGPEQCVDSLNIRSNDFPALAVDHSNGRLAAVWTDTRSGVTGKYDIVVSESSDFGATWSDATATKATGPALMPAGTETYFEPSVAITTGGKVVVSTYRANTTTHAAVGDGTFGYGYLVKPPLGVFGVYFGASDSQRNPSPQANASQAGFLGDYSSVAAGAGEVVYMTWSDTRNSTSAGPDEDVFVFKVTLP
ncbi:MAG: hypothetical protein M3O64_07190 [Chloroflexota bacterium]|nr:hypothetical protein [Chloroflexota bacterium]